MSRIKHIVFIVGGVVTPTITQATLEALDPDRQLDAGSQLVLHGLEKALTIGAIGPQAYCQRVIRETRAVSSACELSTGIPENITLLPEMLPLIEVLSNRLEISLVSDYPGQWARPIIERSDLATYFPDGPDQIISELRTKTDYASVFRRLIDLNVLKPGNSMWVDHHSLRCMAAIRQGIDVGIFVNARRFYRDLGLWGLLA